MSFFHTSRSSPAGKPIVSYKAAGTAVLCAFFISGAAGLIHEVVWTRLLRLVMGNTAFSITTVLCAFMGGLALGSFLGGRFIDRRKDPLRVFAFLEGTIAVYCLFLPWLIQGVEPIYRLIYQNTHTSFYLFSLIRFVFSGVLLLIPATFMGAILPVLSRFFVCSLDWVGHPVGLLYSINTFGAVLGRATRRFLPDPDPGGDPDDPNGLPVQRPGLGNSLFSLPPPRRRCAGACPGPRRGSEENGERGGRQEEKGKDCDGRRPCGRWPDRLRPEGRDVSADRVWHLRLCRPGL
jgi:hypothetical protein